MGVDSYGRMGEGNNLPSPVGGRAAEHGCEGVKAPLKGSVISVARTLRRSDPLPREICLGGADLAPLRLLPLVKGSLGE